MISPYTNALTNRILTKNTQHEIHQHARLLIDHPVFMFTPLHITFPVRFFRDSLAKMISCEVTYLIITVRVRSNSFFRITWLPLGGLSALTYSYEYRANLTAYLK